MVGSALVGLKLLFSVASIVTGSYALYYFLYEYMHFPVGSVINVYGMYMGIVILALVEYAKHGIVGYARHYRSVASILLICLIYGTSIIASIVGCRYLYKYTGSYVEVVVAIDSLNHEYAALESRYSESIEGLYDKREQHRESMKDAMNYSLTERYSGDTSVSMWSMLVLARHEGKINSNRLAYYQSVDAGLEDRLSSLEEESKSKLGELSSLISLHEEKRKHEIESKSLFFTIVGIGIEMMTMLLSLVLVGLKPKDAKNAIEAKYKEKVILKLRGRIERLEFTRKKQEKVIKNSIGRDTYSLAMTGIDGFDGMINVSSFWRRLLSLVRRRDYIFHR